MEVVLDLSLKLSLMLLCISGAAGIVKLMWFSEPTDW